MKKSPFSTPRGYGGYRKYQHKMNSPSENKGYSYHQNNSFDNSSPILNSPHQENDGFIPFNTNSPSPYYNKRHSGQIYRPRGKRNFSFGSQGSPRDNMSPKFYVDSSPTNRYDRTPVYHSKTHSQPFDQIPILQFTHIEDILEDPWKSLMEDYNNSRSSCASNRNDESITSMGNSALEESSRYSQETEASRTNAISDLSTSEIVET